MKQICYPSPSILIDSILLQNIFKYLTYHLFKDKFVTMPLIVVYFLETKPRYVSSYRGLGHLAMQIQNVWL